MLTPPVVAILDGAVLRIEIGRPHARNALDQATADALAVAVRASARTGVRAVLLCAAGPDFTVGGDIGVFQATGDQLGQDVRALASRLHAAVLGLATLEVPVVSAIRGWCAGAGIGLACGADLVLAGHGARFRSSYTGIGFTPDLGLTWLLPRLVGPLRAADMIYTNRVVTAAEALDWGLVSRLVPDDELDLTAATLAHQLADGPAGTHAVVRAMLRGCSSAALEAALAAEEDAVTARAVSAEGREGVAAFRARRPPDFRSVSKD